MIFHNKYKIIVNKVKYSFILFKKRSFSDRAGPDVSADHHAPGGHQPVHWPAQDQERGRHKA